MDTDYAIDLNAIFEVIGTAEVVVFRFVTVPQRLLFDARHGERDYPLLATVPPARSLQERVEELKRMRPRFKVPEKLLAIWWPKYIHSLEGTGAWARIVERLAKEGCPEPKEQAQVVLRELLQRERAESRNAITGVNYHCLWEHRA
jgi:hypothetical protein